MSMTEAPVASVDLWPVGNCQVAGMIDRGGSLVWGCVPRLDGDPTFCALLDKPASDPAAQGFWAITWKTWWTSGQHYIRNTPVLVTQHTDAQGGVIEVVDFCPRYKNHGRMYRPVAFARIVRLAGSPRIRVALRPASEWGSTVPARTTGSHHIRYLLQDLTLRLSTDAPIGWVNDERPFRWSARCTSSWPRRKLCQRPGPWPGRDAGAHDCRMATVDARAWRRRWNGRTR
jgi:GH15 family glucan-1,4-alpha-glucosidase